MKTATMTLTVLGALGMLAGSAQSADWNHIDELANTLERQTAALNHDLTYSYHNAPQFRHLYDDVTKMHGLARHIHDLAHHGRNLRHLESDVRELDDLFHHVEELVAQMNVGWRPYGNRFGNQFGSRSGQVHSQGYGVDRLRSRLAQIGDTLHHLHDDLDEMLRGAQHYRGYAPRVIDPRVVPQPYIPRPGGFTFGGRNFSLTIR